MMARTVIQIGWVFRRASRLLHTALARRNYMFYKECIEFKNHVHPKTASSSTFAFEGGHV
jgi:hypothetical protein